MEQRSADGRFGGGLSGMTVRNATQLELDEKRETGTLARIESMATAIVASEYKGIAELAALDDATARPVLEGLGRAAVTVALAIHDAVQRAAHPERGR